MERKLFFEVMAFMMLFTSCVREQSDCLPNDTRKQVTLKAGLPAGYAQVGTRALPVVPADHYLRCILEVWDETKSNLIQRHEQICQMGDTKKGFEFNFELTEGIYQCLFWADFVDAEVGEEKTMPNVYTHYADKYYTTDGPKGLRGVSIKEGNYAVNTDLRDAFFGKYFLNKTEDAVNNPPISSLTRPFAKLNLMEKNTNLVFHVMGFDYVALRTQCEFSGLFNFSRRFRRFSQIFVRREAVHPIPAFSIAYTEVQYTLYWRSV